MALKKNVSADLKLHYKRTIELSIIISLVLVIGAFRFFPEVRSGFTLIDDPGYEFIKVDIDRTIQDSPKLPPPPMVPIVSTGPEEIIDIPLIIDTGLDPFVNVPPPTSLTYNKKKDDRSSEYFEAVEELPQIVGGLEALYKKIVYPELAVRASVAGLVVVKAYIDKEGNLSKTEIVTGIGAGCDEAAVTAINQLTFTPGKQRGVPVNVKLKIPIRFKLMN